MLLIDFEEYAFIMKKCYFKAEQMSVGYQGVPLIENITIEARQGEILTLIGPNGAGKSTILKSIAKQLALLGGVVCLDGQDIAGLTGNELSRKMAVVFTEKLRTEMMTCQDVVATGRYPYTGRFGILSKEDHRAVENAMELVHMKEIENQDFSKISDGQRQRVMLARAICQEPQILILDEPTSFLDVKHKLEFLSVLQELTRKKGLIVIMSIHELELAERVSDKVLCVKGKYVEHFGPPDEIFRPGYIRALFDIETGSFDEENSSMELQPVKKNAEVFVIAGGGSGKSVYRRLQRAGISFATGILFENDLDYPVARALAAEVVVAASFEPIPEEILRRAKHSMDQCKKVICCKQKFGTFEEANSKLLSYAEENRKQVSYEIS